MAKHILPASVAAMGSASLIWNGVAALAVYQVMSLSASDLDAMSFAQRQIHLQTPQWVNLSFAVAMCSGVIGSIGLLAGRSWAALFYSISVAAIVLQLLGAYASTPLWQDSGVVGLVLQFVVLGISTYLWSYSHKAQARGWLH